MIANSFLAYKSSLQFYHFFHHRQGIGRTGKGQNTRASGAPGQVFESVRLKEVILLIILFYKVLFVDFEPVHSLTVPTGQ